MGKQTPLYARHAQAKGKIVEFGGWDMPLHYGSQLQEHHLVRRGAGVFDVSHMTISDLEGPRAQAFLRHLLANDVARLKTPGKALYSCMLSQGGGVVDDLIVYWLGGDAYRLVTNAATRAKDLAWIRQYAADFEIAPTVRDDLAMLAVQGPQARGKVLPLLPLALRAAAESLAGFHACREGEWLVARTGYTGEDGFEIMLPAEQAPALWDALLAVGVAPVGLGARDTLRLEAGMSLYGQDMDETTTPGESNLGWTVAWTPEDRDFIGRRAIARQQHEGSEKLLVGLVLLEKGVLRPHQVVHVENVGLGEITSGSFSPTLGVSIALARLPAKLVEEVSVDVRGKRLPARVVKPPFVRRGQACIDL